MALVADGLAPAVERLALVADGLRPAGARVEEPPERVAERLPAAGH